MFFFSELAIPLHLSIEKNGELLCESEVESIANVLKSNLHNLQVYVRKKRDFYNLSVIDVIYENGKIEIVFEVSNESELERLFNCLKAKNNLLSSYLSGYFFENSFDKAAGLEEDEYISCSLLMQKSFFHLCSAALSKFEEMDTLPR